MRDWPEPDQDTWLEMLDMPEPDERNWPEPDEMVQRYDGLVPDPIYCEGCGYKGGPEAGTTLLGMFARHGERHDGRSTPIL